MQLAQLVETSAALVATPSRNAKIAIVAQALRAAGGSETGASEVGVVAAYLSNVLPQRRLGVGWRGLADLPPPAAEPSLTVAEVDAAFEEMAAASGAGSSAARRA